MINFCINRLKEFNHRFLRNIKTGDKYIELISMPVTRDLRQDLSNSAVVNEGNVHKHGA